MADDKTPAAPTEEDIQAAVTALEAMPASRRYPGAIALSQGGQYAPAAITAALRRVKTASSAGDIERQQLGAARASGATPPQGPLGIGEQ